MDRIAIPFLFLTCCLNLPAAHGQAPPDTRWELNACIILGTLSQESSSAVAEEWQATWRAAVGYRPSQRWIFLAGYGQTRSRRGESVNEELIDSYTTSGWLSTTYVNVYNCDLLTADQTVHTLALDAAWLIRPYPGRHFIGTAFRLVGGLHLLGVRTEQGVVTDHTYRTEDNTFWDAVGVDTGTSGGDEALSQWGQRQVVNTQWSMGLNLHLGIGMDLNFSKYFAISYGLGVDLAMVEPEIKRFSVGNDQFRHYSLELGGFVPSFGVRLAF